MGSPGKPLLFIHHINLTFLHYLQDGGKAELIKCIYSELQQIGGEGEGMWADITYARKPGAG